MPTLSPIQQDTPNPIRGRRPREPRMQPQCAAGDPDTNRNSTYRLGRIRPKTRPKRALSGNRYVHLRIRRSGGLAAPYFRPGRHRPPSADFEPSHLQRYAVETAGLVTGRREGMGPGWLGWWGSPGRGAGDPWVVGDPCGAGSGSAGAAGPGPGVRGV